MAFILTVSSGEGVPAGSYWATFAGVEPVNNEFGDGLRWQFQVASGPHKGSKTSRTTQPKPSPKNGCGKVLMGLLGRSLNAGETFDVEQFVGKTYLIVVAQTENGGSRVDSVTQPPTQ